jgi:futalosine hydrolase
MRILIVSATPFEIAPVIAALEFQHAIDSRTKRYRYAVHDVDVVISGVGMVATAAWCAAAVARRDYDLALNLGLCGSFDSTIGVERVVHVVTDSIPELGAEDDEQFLTIQELRLLGVDEAPFTQGRLTNRHPPKNRTLNSLPAVTGITVNTVHGNDASIAAVTTRFAPQIESMEGAAFMYVCLTHGLPFAQVRAVSNRVEKRNRAAWRIEAAIDALGRTACAILDHT